LDLCERTVRVEMVERVSNHNRVGLAVAEWDRLGRAVDGSHGRQPSPDDRAHVPRRLDSDDPDVGVGKPP